MSRNALPNVFSAELRRFFSVFPRCMRRAFLTYILGLVMLPKFRSLQRIAEDFGRGQVDTLHHFLRHSGCRAARLLAALREQVRERLAAAPTAQALPASGGQALLIIDDTPIERAGKHIEGAGWHHGPKGLVYGQCVVTAVLRLGSMVLGLAAKGYRSKRTCPAPEFRSKVQLALEVLAEWQGIHDHLTVLLDNWYACREVLNRITSFGWRYVAAIKPNRRILLDGHKSHVRCLAKGPRSYATVRLSRKRKVRVAKRIIFLPKVGMVALFITKVGGATKYLISNDLLLSAEEAVRLYARRWAIETWHREMKQQLGLGELFVRRWQACQKHWTLCLVAHNALVGWNARLPAHRRKHTLGGIVRAFRQAVPTGIHIRLNRRKRRAA